MRTITVTTILVLILAGCATSPTLNSELADAIQIDMQAPVPKIEISEARNAAVGSALTSQLLVRKISRTCKNLHPEISDKSDEAIAIWRIENGSLVRSADDYLDISAATIAHAQGMDLAKIFYLSTFKTIFTHAQGGANDILADQEGNTYTKCIFVLKKIKGGSLALSAHPEFFIELLNIKKDIDIFKQENPTYRKLVKVN